MKTFKVKNAYGHSPTILIDEMELKHDSIAVESFAVSPSLLKGMLIRDVDKGISLILRKLVNPYPVDVYLSKKDDTHVEIIFCQSEYDNYEGSQTSVFEHQERIAAQFRAVLRVLRRCTAVKLPFEFMDQRVEWLDCNVTIVAEMFEQVIEYIEKIIAESNTNLSSPNGSIGTRKHLPPDHADKAPLSQCDAKPTMRILQNNN